MNIPPLSMEQNGRGIAPAEQPERVAIKMSDPVMDLEYAWNEVTFGLSETETAGIG